MRKTSLSKLVVVIIITSLLAGCASFYQAQVLSGEAIRAIGNEFVATAESYNRLWQEKKISKEEYVEFWAWAESFKIKFSIAADEWRGGTDQEGAARVISELRRELVRYAARAKGR